MCKCGDGVTTRIKQILHPGRTRANASSVKPFDLKRRLSDGAFHEPVHTRHTDPGYQRPAGHQPSGTGDKGPLGESGALSEVPDWTENAVKGGHLFVPCNSTESCHFPPYKCSKAKHSSKTETPRIKCVSCRIVIHLSCKDKLKETQTMCRPTYKEPLGNQIGHNGNNDYTRHHWILRKRCDGRCVSCQKKFEKNFFVGGTGGEKSHEYRAITCSWCKDSYHSTKEACFNYHDKLTEPCTLGEHKKLIVPPYWIIKTRRSTRPFRKRSKASESTTRPASLKKSFLVRPKGDYVEKTPLLVFINPKSGGNQGRKVMSELQYLLNPRQVFDLTQGGPNEALELYKSVPNLRILCCGGDGTCGWVMSAIDKIGFRRMPPVGVLPLGTGNDLSRSLDWGPGYTDTCLKKILNQIERANVEHMDRWHIETSDPVVELPLNVMNNYFSIGVDAKTSLKFHSEREANPEKFNSRFGNMVRYAHYGMAEFIKYKAETWKHVTLVCDGVDLTEKLHEIHAVSLIVLNIPSYSAGYMPWGTPSATSEFTDSRISDQKFEVIACSQQQFANVYIGKGTGERIAQAREIEIKIHTPLAVQIDGEATKIDPTTIRIRYNNQHKVLIRKKNDQEVRLPYHHKGECQQLKLIELRRSDSDEQLVDASAEQKMTEHELGMLSLPLDIDLETNRTRIEEHLRERVSDDLDDFYYVDGVTEDFEPLQKSRELTLLRDFLDEGETVLRIRRDIQNCQADSRDNRYTSLSSGFGDDIAEESKT